MNLRLYCNCRRNLSINKLKLYRIKIEYIKYLYKYDNRVQYNPKMKDIYTERRPYLGVVLKVNNLNYFVPLEHPRKQHKEFKNNPFIFKIHKGKYGLLGFNNMIPINDKELIEFDINKESDKYKQILISQYRFCNKHIQEILAKANDTYIRRISESNVFFNKVCCDFKLLEKKCNEWDNW